MAFSSCPAFVLMTSLCRSTRVSIACSLCLNALAEPLFPTDTRHYWKLTKHIFRYSHASADAFYNGAHTINEAIKPTAVIEKISFHTKFLLNWDESDI